MRSPSTSASSYPEFFAIDQSGSGQGAVLNSNTASVAGPSNIPGARPAAKGQPVSIYCTGLGFTTPVPANGAAAPSNPPAKILNAVTVSIGNVPATVLFAGLAPGSVGLYQVDVIVPPNAPSGDAVRLTMATLGRTSNAVTIAVQ